MHRLNQNYLWLLPAIILLLAPIHGHAGTFTANFYNEYQTDAVYLFLYDDGPRDVFFQDVTFSGPRTWEITDQTDTFLHFSGANEAGPRDLRFRITFADGHSGRNIQPFTLEWAEYLAGGPSTSNAMGTLSYERNRGRLGWVASSDFTSTVPTPIPGSTWLLLSGIFFLAGVRRQTGR